MGKRTALREAIEDGDYWRSFGAFYGFGRLLGWTFRKSALFLYDGKTINVDGALLTALLRHRESALKGEKARG